MFDITIAITSCGRIRLLKKTIESLAQSIDLSKYDKIITEDSKDDDVIERIEYEQRQGFLQGRKIIYTGKEFNIKDPFQSHKKALDILYNSIQTLYVFHCEDDRYFKKTDYDYLQLSKEILEKNSSIGIVSLRNWFQKTENNIGFSNKKIATIYFSDTRFHYCGFTCIRLKPYSEISEFYTLNPGLRRTKESQVIIVGHEDFVDEGLMGQRYKEMDLFTVNLEPPIVGHIGGLHNSTRFFKDGLWGSLFRVCKNGWNYYLK